MKVVNEVHVCFVISFLVHAGLIGAEFIKFESCAKTEELEIKFEIEEPEYLPELYKIKEVKEVEDCAEDIEDDVIAEKPDKIEEDVFSDDNLEQKSEDELHESLLRYQDSIKQKIQANRKYPRWALRAKHSGNARVVFSVVRSGQVKDVELVSSSGFNELDNEALCAVNRSSPFFPFPDIFKESEIEIVVDIVFRMKV